MTTLIKAATVVDEKSAHHLKVCDILIENGTIKQIAENISKDVDNTIEHTNLHISQGWFDSSVSFGEPGYEERETIRHGLKVAEKSGFTDVVLNPITNPVIDNSALVQALQNKASGSKVSLHICGALTKNANGIDLAELYDMHQHGAVSFADYKRSISNPNLLKIALQYVQNFDGLVQSFPQDNQIAGKGQVNENHNSTMLGLKGIPAFAEELQIARDLKILEYTGGKLHIPTVSTKKSVELIKKAKSQGLDVSCSVAIHHLVFTDEKLSSFDSNFKLQPPLRTNADRKALIKGLQDGIIDMVTSDHLPMDVEHKKVEFDNAAYGSLGLESSFGQLIQLLTLTETINVLTKGKSRFNIKERTIKEGEQPSLTLFNPETSTTLQAPDIKSTSKNSAFIGTKHVGEVYGILTPNL